MDKPKTFQIRISGALFEKAAALAKQKGISLAEFIRFLIIKEIDQSDKK